MKSVNHKVNVIILIVLSVSKANVILPYDPIPYAFMPNIPATTWPFSPYVNPYWYPHQQQLDEYYYSNGEPSETNSNGPFFKSGSNDQGNEGIPNDVDDRQLSIQFFPHLLPLQLNPNSPMLEESNTCISKSGENGACTSPLACVVVGRQVESNSTCRRSNDICCIRTRQSCGRTIYRNNTFWNSPNSLSSTCQLTVRMNPRLLVQQRGLAICQVRLDFFSFSIAQPNSQSVCSTDKFTVIGASNNVPTICGDATGQHMYLTVPSPNSQLSLLFTLGQGGTGSGWFNNRPSSAISRSWRIKVGLIPCGTNYLAPSDCLQYFTGTSGTISSFNWLDTTSTSTRQLANQDYNICFRSEMIDSSQVSSALCMTPCSQVSKTASSAFSISGLSAVSNVNPGACNNDYLIIAGGYDPSKPHGPNNAQDRFCGAHLNVENNADTSSTICTTAKNYKILYRTNADETLTATADATEIGNLGFCLSFSQN